ncbi:MAG: VWA domain-containing protein [Acidobacteria bacterium]|nr:VWA domain-containing protein [Acidobacteriota bacterium]
MAGPLRQVLVLRAGCLIFGSLLTGAVAGQVREGSSEPPRATFLESVHVKVVNVQVFVRDKDGNPVTGLTRKDFILREEKDPVTITNFYEVQDRVKVSDVPGLVPEEPEIRFVDRPGLERRRVVVPEDERLNLVIYIDHMNIRPQNRNRVFRYVREFLRKDVTRDDRVMLLSYNRSVKVERDFTSDPQMIANALYELEKHTGGRTQWDSDRADIIRDIGEEDRHYEYVQGRVRIYSQSIFNDMQFTLDGLKDTVISLAGLPGRKAFMYVSDGLPMRAGADMWQALDERGRTVDSLSYNQNFFLDSLQYDSSRRFQDLVDTANGNEVSFYTVVAAGPMGINSRDASMQGMAFSSNIDSVARDNVHSSVMYMAEETGGQYIVNTNNFRDGLNRIALDFTSYYSLGFQPGHAGTGRRYKLRVELTNEAKRRLGLRDRNVRHRLSYRDKSIDTEMTEGTLAALKLGYEKNDLDITLVKSDEIRREERGLYTVHLDVRVPIGEMTLVPVGTAGEHLLRARVWVQALASNGDISPPQVEPFEVTIPAEDLERARESFYTYRLPLIMKEGDQRLTIAVRDEVAGETSFITRNLRVGA